jgi:PQQ-like domain
VLPRRERWQFIVVQANSGSAWPMRGHDAHATNFNPRERGITLSLVSRLHRVWSFPHAYQGGFTAIAGPSAVYVIVSNSSSPPSSVAALDVRTGRVLRVFGSTQLGLTGTRTSPIGDSPEVLAYGGGKLIVGATTETVALDPATGRRYWRVPGGAFFLTVAGGVVYTGKGCQNPCGPIASQAIDIASGRVIWSHAGNGGGSPLLMSGYLYQDWAFSDLATRVRVYHPKDGRLATTLPRGAVPSTGDGHSIYTSP